MYTEAKYLWADGRIRFNHGEPLLGDHWPRAVIPFWCQWVKDSNLEFQPIWSRIESDDFWRAALPLVKHAEKMELLKMAAQYGNLSVFRQMNIQDVSHYASTVSTTPLTWYHIVHPTVLERQ